MEWKIHTLAIGKPEITIHFPLTKNIPANVKIEWIGEEIIFPTIQTNKVYNDTLSVYSPYTIMEIYDPQQILKNITINGSQQVNGTIISQEGKHTFFIRVKEKEIQWWIPINVNVSTKSNQKVPKSTKAFSHVITDKCIPVNLDNFFNSSVTDIFRNQYLTPRPPYTSLQIPFQGIVEWCHQKLSF